MAPKQTGALIAHAVLLKGWANDCIGLLCCCVGQPPAVQPKVSPLPPHPIRSAQPRTPRRAQSLDPEEMLELAADAFDLYDTSGSGMLDQVHTTLMLLDANRTNRGSGGR